MDDGKRSRGKLMASLVAVKTVYLQCQGTTDADILVYASPVVAEYSCAQGPCWNQLVEVLDPIVGD